MSDNNLMEQYDERLNNLPEIDKTVEEEIKKYEELVDDQKNQINLQAVKVKAMESEIIKYDKLLEKTENQIQELSSSEEKNAAKEKKYFMQIQNYNKKIETGKAEGGKLQKSILLLKKQIKAVESSITSTKSEKNKIEQLLTKEQIKINNYTQTLNDLKFKIMEQSNKGQTTQADTQKDEKQIQQLFNAIKKQMALIDILKKQKVHIVASTVFRYCEQQFEQVLEMNGQK